MVYKVNINNNKNTPINYLPNLNNFSRRKQYCFSPGVNIIVGENGCGKTTLLKLIQSYLLVGKQECEEKNIHKLFENFKLQGDENMLDGVDVYADYSTNVFRLAHPEEYKGKEGLGLQNFQNFGVLGNMATSSTGEGVIVAINRLWQLMFSKNTNLSFPTLSEYNKERYSAYLKYIENHRIIPKEEEKEITILMDEPDRNLSLENIIDVKEIFSFHKPNTQLIAVIHNPFLIYSVSKMEHVNIIEMTKGYVNKVKKLVNKMIKD